MIAITRRTATSASSAGEGPPRTRRDSARAWSTAEALDLVITTRSPSSDCTAILDKAASAKHGPSSIGTLGSPDVMRCVHPKMIVGVTTEAISGEGSFLNRGRVDTHVISSVRSKRRGDRDGVPTLLGVRNMPATGTNITTVQPGVLELQRHARCRRMFAVNIGLTGKEIRRSPRGSWIRFAPARSGSSSLGLGNDSRHHRLAAAGAAEDEYVQIPSTPTLSTRAAYVDDSIALAKGRTIHTYHSEGSGGGHAPGHPRVCGEPIRHSELA